MAFVVVVVIALHCLHCILLHCIALHCIASHCIALHCIALHRIASHCIQGIFALLSSALRILVCIASHRRTDELGAKVDKGNTARGGKRAMWGFLNRGIMAPPSVTVEPPPAAAAGCSPLWSLSYGGGRCTIYPPHVGQPCQSLSSSLLAVGPLLKRGRGRVNKCNHIHQDDINYVSCNSVVHTVNDNFSAKSSSRKDTG